MIIKAAVTTLLLLIIHTADAGTYCYRCVSTHPGCSTPFNWYWHTGQWCPEEDDICVKITERKGPIEVITRDCLSAVKPFRTDIPADRYEGCRFASKDVKLAHYVNNSIAELDIRRDHFDETTWCFCYFDWWCNSGFSNIPSKFLVGAIFILVKYILH
ncbi:UPAR/Ly6 domain-containing protein crim [Cloeon dipterum]|uniref:UPAR/Ly6 domain-containing protein crim n=1 Tax=Cloeon dipterum TaxID=197152 RepID=UPI00321F87BA